MEEIKLTTQGLPDKFTGEEGKEPVEIWVRKWESAKILNGWTEKQSQLLFITLLTGSASLWQYNKSLDKKTEEWTNDQWIKAMQERYSGLIKSDEKKYNLYELAQMRPEAHETLMSFNLRHRKYLAHIPTNMYTAELLRDLYLKTLHKIDHEIWWICVRDETLKTYYDVLNKATELDELKRSALETEDNQKEEKQGIRTTSEFAKISDINELAQQFRSLALLVNQKKPSRPLSEVMCYNCNQLGHYANNCTVAPRNRKQQQATVTTSPATGANAVPLGSGQGFLARDENEVFATKRMRIDTLLNHDKDTKDTTSVGINTKKIYGIDPKKLKNSNITKLDSNSMVERILNEPAPITTRELLRIQPHLKSTIITRLNNINKTKNALFTDDKRNRYSYIKATINKIEVPIYLDSGSSYSIAETNFVKKLGYVPSRLDDKIMLTPIQGEPVEISEYVVLPVDMEGTIIPITFLLMEPCASSILIGLDVLVQLKTLTNYAKQTLTIIHEDETFTIQLYTKEDISNMIEGDSEDPAFRLTESTLNDYFKKTQPLLDKADQLKLSSLLLSNVDLFAESFTDIPGIKDSDYDLVLLDPDHVTPIKSKLKRYTVEERQVIKDEITKMLEANIIEPSFAPWCSPIKIVPKPDGSPRFCINYFKLNALTKKDTYPLPRIDDLIDMMAGKTYITTLDCFSGYWQVRLSPQSKDYTTFISPFGIFRFNVMPFGLTNAPAHFSRVMNRIFCDYVFVFMLVYLDDLCIISSSFQEHLEHLNLVFLRLREWNVKLKFKKCDFLATKFLYLGLYIDADGIHPDPSKVSALVQLPRPRSLKELRSFYGLASYFRRFISNFAQLTFPLSQLLKSSSSVFSWGVEAEKCFSHLKDILTSAPVLKLPTENGTFVLSTDASSFALGACLEQWQDNILVPICYYSRVLQPAERNYSAYEKEALAVISSVKQFRKYLLPRPFYIYTDNSAVASLLNAKDPSGRIIRWTNCLMEFNFTLKHRSGKENIVADFLSRHPAYFLSNNLKSELTYDKIKELLQAKESENISSRDLKIIKKFIIFDDQLFRRTVPPTLVISNDTELFSILDQLHDKMGHFSFETIYKWMKDRYWSKNMYNKVKHYVNSCMECQKYQLKKPLYKFLGQSSITGMFQEFAIDFLGPFPPTKEGFRFIIVAVEKLSRYPIAKATRDQVASTAVDFVKNEIIAQYGCPRIITVDGGSCFISSVFQSLAADYNIQLNFTPGYQPEWNGTVERLNRTIRYALTKTIKGNFADWNQYLFQVLFGIRARISNVTGYSPFFLMYGTHPRLPGKFHLIDPLCELTPENVELRTLENGNLPGHRSVLIHDSIHSSKIETFAVNDLVMLLDPSIRKKKFNDKKAARYLGPFKVMAVHPHNSYTIDSESGKRLLVHVSRLRKFIPRFPSRDNVLWGVECEDKKSECNVIRTS